MADLSVAHTIRNQLGPVALMLIGAKNFVGSEKVLQFSIGQNAKRISVVRVILEPDDTYRVDFLQKKKPGLLLKHSELGVYVDSLKRVIESNTGLYLSFS